MVEFQYGFFNLYLSLAITDLGLVHYPELENHDILDDLNFLWAPKNVSPSYILILDYNLVNEILIRSCIFLKNKDSTLSKEITK